MDLWWNLVDWDGTAVNCESDSFDMLWFSLNTPKDPKKQDMKGDERSKVEQRRKIRHVFMFLIPPRQITGHPCLFQASSCDFLWWMRRLVELASLCMCDSAEMYDENWWNTIFFNQLSSCSRDALKHWNRSPATLLHGVQSCNVERKIKGSNSAACWWGCCFCARSNARVAPVLLWESMRKKILAMTSNTIPQFRKSSDQHTVFAKDCCVGKCSSVNPVSL